MRYDPSFLEEIKDRLPLSLVIGRKVKLKKTGRVYKGLCFHHREKTPSLIVDDQRGLAHCHGCDWGGDIFTFEMHFGLSFNEAVERLASEAGLALPQRGPEATARAVRRHTLAEVVAEAERWFAGQLREPWAKPHVAYLHGRGITSKVIDEWGVGFAPGNGSMRSYLCSEGVTVDDQVEAGLLARGDDGSTYPVFRDRVVFPIRERGRTVAFTGRSVLPPEVQAEKHVPKYLNSPETPLFTKGHTLYNCDSARTAAHDGEATAVVVEGPVDVIAMVGAGFPASVAPMGTAITADQLRLMWRMSDSPVVCLDGDAAGLQAMNRAIAVALPLLTPSRTLRFARLPDGLDPDDMVRKRGKEAMARVIAGSQSFCDALWLQIGLQHYAATPEAASLRYQAIRSACLQIADLDLRAEYLRDLRARQKTASARPTVVRSNSYSHHSTSPGSLRLSMGLSQGMSLRDASLICAAAVAPGEFLGLAEKLHCQGVVAATLDELAMDQGISALDEARSVCRQAGLSCETAEEGAEIIRSLAL